MTEAKVNWSGKREDNNYYITMLLLLLFLVLWLLLLLLLLQCNFSGQLLQTFSSLYAIILFSAVTITPTLLKTSRQGIWTALTNFKFTSNCLFSNCLFFFILILKCPSLSRCPWFHSFVPPVRIGFFNYLFLPYIFSTSYSSDFFPSEEKHSSCLFCAENTLFSLLLLQRTIHFYFFHFTAMLPLKKVFIFSIHELNV